MTNMPSPSGRAHVRPRTTADRRPPAARPGQARPAIQPPTSRGSCTPLPFRRLAQTIGGEETQPREENRATGLIRA
ncbi:hypothetical protein CDD83_10071 [Cordyceps sp. RAO-2017]|nr:hypothetical protein CDD83_10071 [Cordyceps sp. RAO-2017]